ncbi:hypothetical protein B7P43_G12731 [Cryptotermes secundus]|uniref:RING-type domain-containing protein n=3 Tax=Cryptotermes secundus TaxID=105785 RepID=A0A2J7PZ28_9NEOP|nr:hypothetical protein B7P43_G12731 [Cryptotermes secundus]
MSLEHHGSDITALQWNISGNELFVGDDCGKVSVVRASPFGAKSMFQTPSFMLMQLDSRIVQLDWCSELLLVSTLSRCYICDSVKEQYRQIGQKLREGEYGACFYADDSHDLPSRCEQRSSAATGAVFSSLNEDEKFAGCEDMQNLKIFCARPGSRLWEVHVDGTVLSTHHFKQAFAVPPTCIIRPRNTKTSHQEGSGTGETSQTEPWGQQSFNFRKLHVIAKKFLFTFRRNGMYALDPSKGSVVLWNNSFTDIVDAKTLNDTIYVWTAAGNMHALVMLPVDGFLVRLYLHKQYSLCAQICQQYNNYLMELAPTSSKLHLLADLETKLEDEKEARKISPLLQEIGKHMKEKQNAQRLKSGIFLVENEQFHWGRVEEDEQKSLKSYPNVHTLNVNGQKEKSRSLTASPENNRREKSGSSLQAHKSVGSTSLPELADVVVSADDDVLFRKKIFAMTVPYDNHLVSETNSEFRACTEQSDSEMAFPPEALQALKELKQSVSWKSLKQKWQMLESKMKLLSQDTNCEPLDIRPPDYHEGILEEAQPCESVVDLVHSCSDKPRHRTAHFPVLDTSDVINLCNHFVTCEQNGSDTFELICKLLNALSNIYDLFVTGLIKTQCGVRDVLQSSDLKSDLNIITMFPFAHYFADDIVKIISDKFHLALQTGHLVTWLYDRIKEVQLTDQFPDNFKDLYAEDILKVDILLSRILVTFSELFDPVLTLQYIQTSQLHCYYLALCVILDRYEEGNLSYVSDGVSGHAACDELPPPLLLSTIFFMLKMERIETCCELSERVSVKDVWYLVTRLQEHLEGNAMDKDAARLHCSSLFLTYLEKMPASSDCLSKVFADNQLRLYVTAAFVELNSVMGASCVCGFPLLRPQLLLFPWLAEVMVLYHWKNNRECLAELCKKVPSLWHFVLPHKRSEGFSSVLPLVIHLGDTLELGRWLPCLDHADWVKTLELLTTFQAGTCLNCGSVFTISGAQPRGVLWSSVGLLMVKSLGPHVAVQLLTKYVGHIKPGELDARFYQACIYSTILDNHAEGLRDKVIDVLSACSKKTSEPALFSPVVYSAVQEALREDLGKYVEFPVASEKHHWGVKVNIADGSCPWCALPLGSAVLMKDGGVTTFRCGHSYHEVCLRRHTPSRICPICTKNS